MANAKNIKPMSERSEEERRELGRKGGVASGAARRRKKSLREAVDQILALPIKDQKMNNRLRNMGIEETDADYQAAIVMTMVREALAGEVKAAKLLVELAEEQERSGRLDTEDDPLTASLKEMMGEV